MLTAFGRQRAQDVISAALTRPPAERDSFLADSVPDVSTRDEISAIIRTCEAQTVADTRPALPLERIGPYVLERTLGEGGMGRVYLARDTRLNRHVAIKALSSRNFHDIVARVMREATAAAQINDPRIAAVYDVLEVENTAYIVMEYVPGPTLAQHARHRPLPAVEVARVGAQIADALVRAHRAGIVHCDLKPSNIKVTDDGGVKILDFGLARQTIVEETPQPLTVARAIGGTPGYMSPEQILGRPVDARSDVYSLGVILFELAAGLRPFPGSDAVSIALATLTEPTPRLPDSVPAALRDLVARCLEKERDRRVQTAVEVRDALQLLCAPPVPSPAITRTGAVAAAVVLAAGIGGLVWFRPAPPRTKPVIAILPFTAADGHTTTPLATGLADILASDLSEIPGLVLVPRNASVQYSADPATFPRIADALGADTAITGTVDERDGTLHTEVALRDLRTRATLWRKDFTAAADDVMGLERAIANASIERLGGSRAAGARGRAARVTADRQAFEDYSQGRAFLDRPDDAGTIDRALTLFERAAARDSQFALAYAAIGEAAAAKYSLTRDRALIDRARDALLKALSLDPNQPMVRYALATVYRLSGKRDDAIAELRKAIDFQPSNDEFHRLLGRIYGDMNRTEEAVAEFKLALALRPGFWDTYRGLGFVYYTAGRYEEAIAAFKRATELRPDSNSGFQMLGATYQAAGDLPRAIESYERANAIGPSATAWSNIGMIRHQQHRYADAVAAYKQSIALRPREATTFRNLGDAYAKLPDAAAARDAYTRAIDLARDQLGVNPTNAELLALEALCLAKLGRQTDAQALAARADALAPQSATVLYKHAMVEALGGRADAAIRLLEAALAHGASRDVARTEDEFTSLRTLPAFRSAVDQRSQ